MLRIFTDTDTDISPKVAKEYGYSLISMPYTVDGKSVSPYVDYEEFDARAFYDTLREGALPTTSAISTEAYKQYFEPVFASGDDILYVHFSAAMTITFNNMDIAVKELLERYPDRKFYSIDTKGITTISYVIAKEIGKLYKAGKSAEEIVEWANKEVDHFAMYFFADDLKFFKRSGRVGGLAATMGTLLGVRPIIHMSAEGKMVSIGKERGRTNAMERLIAYVEELGEDITSYTLAIGHTDALEIAQELGEMLKEKLEAELDIEYVVVNPTAGSHCGPNGVGICFHAKNR